MEMASIPTGMTCAGVHRAVIEHLLREDGSGSEKRVLDIPCGNADLMYLLLGKTRRFQMFVDVDAPTWKVIPLYNLLRLLQTAGFRVRRLQYVSAGWKDWLLLPLALVVYPLQSLYIRLTRNPMSLQHKRHMYPFRSLLCSHYVVYCDKVASARD